MKVEDTTAAIAQNNENLFLFFGEMFRSHWHLPVFDKSCAHLFQEANISNVNSAGQLVHPDVEADTFN